MIIMSIVVKKIRLEKDENGNPFIYLAWDDQENIIIAPDSTIRPEIIVENGMVTQILMNERDIEIPDFEPFSVNDTLHFFNAKSNNNRLSEPLAWELSHKLLKMVMDDGKLVKDYGEKLKIAESEFDKFGDVALKDLVLSRINQVIIKYKKTGIWDFVLLGK